MACHSTSQARTLKIAVLDTPPGYAHSQKVIEVIQSNYSASCRLEIELYPIYNNGNLTVQGFRSALQKSQMFSPAIINISWNTVYRRPYNPIVKELRKFSHTGFLVTAAGQDRGPNRHDIHELSGTVMGKVSKALIIGALSDDGRLAPRTFHGELLTALPPPEGTLGSSFSAAFFTAKLAETLCRRKEFNLEQLLQNKQNSQQKFPLLEQLFQNQP